MFTLNEINQEVQKYNKYTSYNVPKFQSINHDDSDTYLGKIKSAEIINNNFVIHISNKLYDSPLEFQKSVVWHEITHLHDELYFRKQQPSNVNGIMKTYSEAHATSIQLRYLLHISTKQIVNQGKRLLMYINGKEDLGFVTANYINNSIQALNDFQKTKSPQDFNLFINNFCYFCGYMMLKKTDDANKLFSYVITKYPKHKTDLQLLYKSIINNDFEICSNIYSKLKTEAMIDSLNVLKEP